MTLLSIPTPRAPRHSVLRASRSALFALAAMGMLLTQAAARAQRDRDETLRSSPGVLAAFRPVVAKPARSLVRIQCDGKDVALGTVVGGDGWVLTKASQLRPDSRIVCRLRDGRTFPAKVTGVEETHDLALLKIDARGLVPVEWGESKRATPGDWVASPGTDSDPVGVGVVSVAARTVPPRGYPVAINPNGGFLGINLAGEEDGVRVGMVQPNTGAAKAGIKPNDIILAVNGRRIRTAETLLNILGRHRPNDTITVRIKRGSDELELKAILGKRPPEMSRAEFQNRMGGDLSDRRTGFPSILQHDTVLRPADCGGPLVDLDGKALGINIARAGRTETYAIPSETVRTLLKDLQSGRLAPKTEPVTSAKEDLARLEAEVRQAERSLAALEKKASIARALLERAREAKEQDPQASELHEKASRYAAGIEKQLAQARSALDRARAELKQSQKK